jgi:hypothetical protein
MEYLTLFSVAAAAGFAIRAWSWWGKQPERFPKPQFRSIAGFIALVAATCSTVLWVGSVTTTWMRGAFAGMQGVAGGPPLLALTGLCLSPLGNGKTRQYAAILSLAMLIIWLAYAYFRVSRRVWL